MINIEKKNYRFKHLEKKHSWEEISYVNPSESSGNTLKKNMIKENVVTKTDTDALIYLKNLLCQSSIQR